jgi:hypothetical protein
MADIDIDAVRKQNKAEYKSKSIPSIFSDESTELFMSYMIYIHVTRK